MDLAPALMCQQWRASHSLLTKRMLEHPRLSMAAVGLSPHDKANVCMSMLDPMHGCASACLASGPEKAGMAG